MHLGEFIHWRIYIDWKGVLRITFSMWIFCKNLWNFRFQQFELGSNSTVERLEEAVDRKSISILYVYNIFQYNKTGRPSWTRTHAHNTFNYYLPFMLARQSQSHQSLNLVSKQTIQNIFAEYTFCWWRTANTSDMVDTMRKLFSLSVNADEKTKRKIEMVNRMPNNHTKLPKRTVRQLVVQLSLIRLCSHILWIYAATIGHNLVCLLAEQAAEHTHTHTHTLDI